MMLTGVREEEVGEAVIEDVETLEVGDAVPPSARDIAVERPDLFGNRKLSYLTSPG